MARVLRLSGQGIPISVGVVGVAGALDEIRQLRQALPFDIYLWINAQQPRPRPYSCEELEQFTAIDPHFPLTVRRTHSRDRYCPSGETSFTFDGDGAMRRCHFVDEVIGRIHDSDWEAALRPRHCPNQFCHCFLGKAQLESETFGPLFGESLLTRNMSANIHE